MSIDLKPFFKNHPDVTAVDDRLCATFTFDTFKDAFAFIAAIAFVAEQQNHHPRIENEYNIVKVSCTTHDAGNKITKRDTAFFTALYEFINHDKN